MMYPFRSLRMRKVDLALYAEREQAYVKHCLLEEYLVDWAYKVGRKWDTLVYIDGFAGPWETKDPNHADSSFAVGIQALRSTRDGLRDEHGTKVGTRVILCEKRRGAFASLKQYAEAQCAQGFDVHALKGCFAERVPDIKTLIARSGRNPFRFVFLDPKGWADIPIEPISPLLQDRSCEVLVNIMARDMNRFFDEPDRAKSIRQLFGRDGVYEKLQVVPTSDRPDLAVREYCKSLRSICGFKYVSSAVVLDPIADEVKYFLVFASHHPDGVVVFKAAETKAARIQDDVRERAKTRGDPQGSLDLGMEPPRTRRVRELLQRYLCLARQQVMQRLASCQKGEVVRYTEVFCEAMAFPLVRPEDLQTWITDLQKNCGAVELTLPGSGRRWKADPSEKSKDTVTVVDPAVLKIEACC